MSEKITIKAPAKINLLLDVVGKRPDGYHTLKSIFQSVSLYDELEVELNDSGKLVLLCDNEDIPCDDSNLVSKAYKAFFEYSGIKPAGVTFSLEKNIPSMAGLGGGSTDCAAALIALNILFDTGYDTDTLCDIGEKLGADVPFCIVGGTVLCEGIGEILTPMPDLPECAILVAKPDLKISTPECYKKFDSLESREHSKLDDMIAGLAVGSIGTVAECLGNDLEIAADSDEIRKIKEVMTSCGAMGACMTGSGSAVFGIFENKRSAKDCLKQLEDSCPFTAVLKPTAEGCIVE